MKLPYSYVTLQCKVFNPSGNVLPLRVEVKTVEVSLENKTITVIIVSAEMHQPKLKVIIILQYYIKRQQICTARQSTQK